MSTIELTSVGQAAALFQRHPSSIRKAAEELDIEPRFVLNSVPYYDAEDLERVAAKLTEPKQRGR